MKRDVVEFYRALDRSLFIDTENRRFADLDTPLPIGHGQTISQPSLVAMMTDELEIDDQCTVLEIGTGSGYQSAFLAHFARWVYTVECIEELSEKAEVRLEHLGFSNIDYRVDNGRFGWPEFAPFDRIMVTAAPVEIPPVLIEQLRAGGIMIIPVGPSGFQQLLKIRKESDGTMASKRLCDVAFVTLL